MKLLAGLLGAGAIAMACLLGAAPAEAACGNSLTVLDGTGAVKSLAAVIASGMVNSCNVMEGTTPTGVPTPATIDGTDSGLWEHVTNWPTSFLGDSLVVSGDQAFTVGTQQHSTMTPTGRLRVGLSSAGTVGMTAATTADLQGAIDSSGNQQGLHQDATLDLLTVDKNSAALLTAAQATSTTAGAKGDAPCSGDSGTCSLVALIERTNARITSLITALGSPFQAGGSVANTAFAATQSGSWTVAVSTAAFGANLQLAGTAITPLSSASASSTGNVPAVGLIGNLPYIDSTTALTASSAFTGSSRSTPVWATYFNAHFWSDQASAASGAEIDCSLDGGTTWRAEATGTVTASGAAITLSVFADCPAYRVKLTNSTTAETILQLASSFTGG